MTKKILMNSCGMNEIKVAMIENQWLYDLEVENNNIQQRKGNIYKAKISRIEPGLDAVFIDYGNEKHGFLPFREISGGFLNENSDSYDNYEKPFESADILVQIDKEERKEKGVSLTAFISIVGSSLILMPNSSISSGVSKMIEGEERVKIKRKINNIKLPKGMGVIVRTAGTGKCSAELEKELNELINKFHEIRKMSKLSKSPCLLYCGDDLIIRIIRDYFKHDISEIIIDDKFLFNTISQHLMINNPGYLNRLRFYNNKNYIFEEFKIHNQIESIYNKRIFLQSGGMIVIDKTEALISIDINSNKSNKETDIESTATQTNLEAINEISRQIRIKDLSGLIVIDFIDMSNPNNKKTIERYFKNLLSIDKAKIKIGKISKFGLLEISRQKMKNYFTNIKFDFIESEESRDLELLNSYIFKILENNFNSYNNYILELSSNISKFIIKEKKYTLLYLERLYDKSIYFINNKKLNILEYKLFICNNNFNRKLSKIMYKDNIINYELYNKLFPYKGFKKIKININKFLEHEKDTINSYNYEAIHKNKEYLLDFFYNNCCMLEYMWNFLRNKKK